METTTLRKAFAGRAIPGILALLLNSVYVVVDGLFVARLLGREALAAVTVAVPMMEIMIALAMLVSVGAGALISQAQGRGDKAAARDIFQTSFYVMLAIAVLLAGAGLALHRPLGTWLGGTPDIKPMVDDYLFYLFAFSPFLVFSFGLGTWARNDGQPRLAMIAMGVGTVTNIFLDYAFIQWCGWGVGSAALATGLGPVLSCLVLLPHFLRGKGSLYFKKTALQLQTVRAILFSGIPSFMMEFALGMTTFCVNLSVSRHMGALGLAAFGVVGYVALIALTIYLGMAEGLQPLLSFHNGRGDGPAVAYLVRLSLWVSLVSGVALYALLLACAKAPAVLFGGTDETLISLSVFAIRLYFPALFASGMNIQLSSCLQAIGRWQRSAIVSALRAMVLLGIMLVVLPLLWGDTGVWLAVPAAELCTLPIALLLYRGAIASPSQAPATAH